MPSSRTIAESPSGPSAGDGHREDGHAEAVEVEPLAVVASARTR